MNIFQIEAWGFRSLKAIKWNPSNLNVIIGPNGSGKSNLLKLLEFIRVFSAGHLSDHVQNNGGSESFLWDGEGSGLRFHVLSVGIGNTDDEETDGARYEVRLQNVRSEFVIKNEELAGFTQGKSNESFGPFTPMYLVRSAGRSSASVRNLDGELEEIGLDLLSSNESALSLLAIYSQKFFVRRFKRHLDEFVIYQNVETSSESPIRQSRVARYEKLIDANGQNLVNVLHTLYSENREYRLAINAGMQAAFGDDFDEIRFPPASSQRIQMSIQWKSLKKSIPATDLSDGTLRYLFLLAVLSDPNPPSLIAIDEPETGLHPKMLPIIAEYAVQASQKTQVVFTTHSAEFLTAFGSVKPTVTVAELENGETKLKVVSGEALDYWLQDYSLGSLYRSGQLEGME